MDVHRGNVLKTSAEYFRVAFAAEIQKTREDQPDTRKWLVTGRASKLWPAKENRAWWVHHGPLFVDAWIDWRSRYDFWHVADLSTGPGIEIGLTASMGGRHVKMFIDRAFVAPDGQVVIIDLKSGRSKGMPLQVGMYIEGFHQTFGIRPTIGGFWNARDGEVELVDVSKFTTAYLDHTVQQFYTAIEAELFPPSPGPLCNSCSVRQACAVFGGRDAEKYDPDYQLMKGVA